MKQEASNLVFLYFSSRRLLTIGLTVVVVCCYLSGVGCRVLTGDCRVSLTVVVVDAWCRLFIVGVGY
jgi:hypothetical protein